MLHSFFAWAEAEDHVDVDPSRKIRRPPKRKADIYRPNLDELARVRKAAKGYERPAIVLMEGSGLRRSEVIGCRWADIDLVNGRVRVLRKGQHWQVLPLASDVLTELRISFHELQPELDDYVFTVEVELWVSAVERVRRRKDPKRPASDQALMRMVWRVCKRAGVRRLSPHQLRHGFANRFLRESGRDLAALQRLMGHSRPDTTQQYTDEIELDELEEALDRAVASRDAQASPEEETTEGDIAAAVESPEWVCSKKPSRAKKQPSLSKSSEALSGGTARALIRRSCNGLSGRIYRRWRAKMSSAARRNDHSRGLTSSDWPPVGQVTQSDGLMKMIIPASPTTL